MRVEENCVIEAPGNAAVEFRFRLEHRSQFGHGALLPSDISLLIDQEVIDEQLDLVANLQWLSAGFGSRCDRRKLALDQIGSQPHSNKEHCDVLSSPHNSLTQ